MALAIDERRDFADLLETLTPEQWAAPTLCDRWNVRDVVAHVVSYEQARPLALAATFLRAGFRPGRVNDLRLRVYEDSTPGQLVELLRAHLRPRGLTAGFGGGIGLSDCLIHHQDVRRALGLERSVPPDRVREALAVALRAPVLPARANAKGLRCEATDLDWSTGDGPVVTGAGEALLLALAGRAVALDELDGPGLDELRRRVHH
ncbi:MAG: maleylpyruvate isomerase family mycothiol-dependent enzyme [Ilumatobacteraceae bacterium]